MSLLRNAYAVPSKQVLREYLPKITKYSDVICNTITDVELASIKAVDIPCVEVQIPERDWKKIVEIVEAHERTIQDPVMQDAWNKYLMTLRLRQP